MKKSRIISLLMAFSLGVATPIAAASVTAKEGTTKVVIDGKPVAIQSYNIADYNYFKLRDLTSALDIGVTFDQKTNTATIDSDAHYKESATKLMVGNWAPETRAAIQNVIDKNANKGKYVVFDFDNTTVINDVEEALLVYQIENMEFKIKPDQMYDVLDTQIPDMNQAVGKNAAGRDVTCEQLAQDIVSDYKWLYSNSKTLAGSKSLEEIHNSNQYKDFAAKLRFMYTAVGDTFDASVSYP